MKEIFKKNKILKSFIFALLLNIIVIIGLQQFFLHRYNSKFFEKIQYLYKSVNESNCSVFTNILNEKYKIDNEWYPNFLPSIYNKSLDLKCLNSTSQKIKTILLWNKFNGIPLVPIDYGIKKPFEKIKCPVTNCELTNNRSRFNYSLFVLFHLRNNIDYFPVGSRPKDQRWIHVIYESTINCHLCDKYKNVFNLTASYRQESDFSSLYWLDSGLYWDLNLNYKISNNNFNYSNDTFSNNTHLIGTLISHCRDPIGRMSYISELKKYISVDVYGKCGIKCPDGPDKWNSDKCREYISKNYKFFLVFENSFCKGYVTEKFFNALRYDIIPIVLGAGNYSHYIPKSGYIDAFDYKTPESLANYLFYLNNNKTAYDNFFYWKRYINFELKPPNMGYLCEMCIQLHLEDQIGYINKKQIDVTELYNLTQNCYGLNKENNSYEYKLGQNVYFSGYMSVE